MTEYIGSEVKLAPDCIGEETAKMIDAMDEGSLIILENTRFYKEETKVRVRVHGVRACIRVCGGVHVRLTTLAHRLARPRPHNHNTHRTNLASLRSLLLLSTFSSTMPSAPPTALMPRRLAWQITSTTR